MNAQPVPDTANRAPRNAVAATGAAHAGGRSASSDRPPASRRRLEDATVHVAGGAQHDRTALTAALRRAGAGRVAFTAGAPGGALGATVDAVLLVASAERVIDAAGLDLAHTLRHRSPHVLLALTAIDRHPDWSHVLQADIERLRTAGVTVEPFAVSLDTYDQAAAAGDPARAAASGVPALARRLDDIAGQPATSPTRRSRARRDRSGPDRDRWKQVLADGMAVVSSDVDFDLRSRVRTAVADAESVVEASDPARDWTEIDTWFRDRLAYEGEQTFALLADRTAEVAAELERGLGGGPLRWPAPARIPDLLHHQPPRDAPTGIRRPLATRSRSLVMSGYGGLMMALILPRFAGVELPAWVVVAGALGAALLLGGAALSGERKRQLETSRTRAKSLIRHTADGFLLAATKATRDTVHRSRQQLRDECTTRRTTEHGPAPDLRTG